MFDYSKEKVGGSSVYLRTCGVHQGVIFKGLEYVATDSYEAFDLIFDVNGAIFKDRMFGTSLEKAFPKKIYENNVVAGEETKEQAYHREMKERYLKVASFVNLFAGEESVKAMSKFNTFKDLVDKANKELASVDTTRPINILTIWKNNDAKQTSNLILPSKGKFVELTEYNEEGKAISAKIQPTIWQQQNVMIEKYPYGASNEASSSDSTILNDINSVATDDLPF